MTLVDENVLTSSASVSRALVVALWPTGLAVPAYGDHPRIELGLAEVVFLQRLAANSGTPLDAVIRDTVDTIGVDESRLLELVAALRERRLLLTAMSSTAAEPTTTMSKGLVAVDHDFDLDHELRMDTPLVFRLVPQGFELIDHDGDLRIRLDAVELAAVSGFRQRSTPRTALAEHTAGAGSVALTAPKFEAVLRRLAAADCIRLFDPDSREISAGELEQRIFSQGFAVQRELIRVCGERLAEHERGVREREARTQTKRTKVLPIGYNGHMPTLALGMIVAYAQAFEDGRLDQQFDFTPAWAFEPSYFETIAADPGVYLFSNYTWSNGRCNETSIHVKELNPDSIAIHGGPNTPKYRGDVESYFRMNPHVDITVRGEGEATTAHILAALGNAIDAGDLNDRSVLYGVEGISFRDGDKVVHTPDRERIADLDTIPSPYLTGLFDIYGDVAHVAVTIETNRGCPYGCTFCDWGSATTSRIRKFDIDRIFAELEWCAKHQVKAIGLADSNFGIWSRDVEIAEKIAELKNTYGYPLAFGTSYAKNTVKHLKKIIDILVGAGILGHGVLSLQSMDEETLDSIKRSNIKLEKYDDMLKQFRQADLPLYVDLMFGLPGQTTSSFQNDLQGCIDREVQANVHPTELLVNSPMNEPTYKQDHKIETKANGFANAIVVSTTSFTMQDYRAMSQLRRAFLLCEDFGILRQIARFLRQETGIREIDFYEHLRADCAADPETWPMIALMIESLPDFMTAPVSWRMCLDEIRSYVTAVLGVADDSALDTAFAVQHALLPARERQFPITVNLPHDYVAWHHDMFTAKDSDRRDDWPTVVPRLSSYPPARFVVDDPDGVSKLAAGQNIDLHGFGLSWELDSAVARRVDNWVSNLLLDV